MKTEISYHIPNRRNGLTADPYARFRRWVSSTAHWRLDYLIWKVLGFGSGRVRKVRLQG